MKMPRKAAKAIDALATMAPSRIRLKWGRVSQVHRNARRRVRKIFNKLNLQETLENAYRDLIVHGSAKIPLNREN